MNIKSIAGKLFKKAGLKKDIILLLNKLGIGGLNSGDKIFDIRLLVERSSKKILSQIKNANGKRIVFAGVIPGMAEHSITTAIMASSLRLRNAETAAFICDKVMDACDIIHSTSYEKIEDFFNSARPKCSMCYDDAANIFNLLNIPQYKVSGYINNAFVNRSYVKYKDLAPEEIYSFKYQGMDLGEQVRTSVHRFQMRGILINDEETRRIAVRYLVSGITYAEALFEFIKSWKPDTIIATQGIYLMGGVTNEVCKKLNINFFSWDYQYRKNGIYISYGDTYHHELRKEPNEYWENLEMTDARNKILDDYFFSRRNGKLDKDEISYTAGSITDSSMIASKLNLDPEKPVISIFTNVAWDGKVAVSSNIFDGPVELVIETIEHLKNKNDVQLIIRIHPAEIAETKWKGLQRMQDLISEKFPVLPANTKIIFPEEKLSSYGLVNLSKVSVVYSTKLGLEAMLMGKQVIMTGDTFYLNKGFGIQPKTKEDFWKLLANLNDIHDLTPSEIERVRRYTYHFFYRKTLEIPSLYKNRPDTIVINNLAELLPGKNKEIDRLCRGIIDKVPFHLNAG